MKIVTHILVAACTALLAPNRTIGIWVAIAQLLPLADVGLKYIFQYEPLHTFVGTLVLGVLYWANLPFVYGYLIASHALHLVLDMLVPEGITLFEPFSQKRLAFPVPWSEMIIIGGSITIIILVALYRFTN